jgi:hypothetical protein
MTFSRFAGYVLWWQSCFLSLQSLWPLRSAAVAAAIAETSQINRDTKGAKVLTLSKARLYRLLQLAQQLLFWEPQIEAGSALLEPFLGVFGTTAICLFDASTAGLYTIGSSNSGLEDRTRQAYIAGQDVDDQKAGITIRRFVAGGRITGAVAFKELEDPQLTAGPLASLAAAFHERARLRHQASEAAVAAEIEAFR